MANMLANIYIDLYIQQTQTNISIYSESCSILALLLALVTNSRENDLAL